MAGRIRPFTYRVFTSVGGLVACSRLAPLLSVVAVGGPGALGRACALGSSRRVVVLVGVKLGLQVLGLTAESVGPCWLKIPSRIDKCLSEVRIGVARLSRKASSTTTSPEPRTPPLNQEIERK